MKILIVNTSDINGGAARATYRLHKSLLNSGVDSQMLVQDKHSDDYTVIGPGTKIKKAIAKIRPTLDQLPVTRYKKRTKIIFSPAWLPFSGIVNRINEINPDIVHLHWIAGGMLRIEDLTKIKKPIVWSLHDNWAFTGGCHIKLDCDKYKNKCGKCPILKSAQENDLSRSIWTRKKKVFDKLDNLTIVGLSKWIANCTKESSLLKNKKIINLPNPIDTDIFKPFNKIEARKLWNLPKDKRIVLFGAMNATGDPLKGFKELSESLHKISKRDIELVVFGSSEPKESQNFGFRTHYLGTLHDDVSLVTLYSAADVVIVPSLQENLSNVIMESLACGTPVVAFNIGGNSDMIENKINGYLAKPFDTNDLAYGIEWILNTPNYDELRRSARKKVVQEFDSRIVVKKYIELYQEVLKNS